MFQEFDKPILSANERIRSQKGSSPPERLSRESSRKVIWQFLTSRYLLPLYSRQTVCPVT